MIVQFFDTDAGATVYINPEYVVTLRPDPAEVVTLRPDPAEPERVSIVKLRDGESFRVQGTHVEVAAKLFRAP
ncbi:MAG: hypothetical protein K0S35_1621 [Geminicoccaceae bacterium]|nr:hypothetical protein [Geminicoccaceae bacterium]